MSVCEYSIHLPPERLSRRSDLTDYRRPPNSRSIALSPSRSVAPLCAPFTAKTHIQIAREPTRPGARNASSPATTSARCRAFDRFALRLAPGSSSRAASCRTSLSCRTRPPQDLAPLRRELTSVASSFVAVLQPCSASSPPRHSHSRPCMHAVQQQRDTVPYTGARRAHVRGASACQDQAANISSASGFLSLSPLPSRTLSSFPSPYCVSGSRDESADAKLYSRSSPVHSRRRPLTRPVSAARTPSASPIDTWLFLTRTSFYAGDRPCGVKSRQSSGERHVITLLGEPCPPLIGQADRRHLRRLDLGTPSFVP